MSLSLEVMRLPSPPRAFKVLAVEQNSVSLIWEHPQGESRIEVSMCLQGRRLCFAYILCYIG